MPSKRQLGEQETRGTYLENSGAQSILVKIGLGQALEGVLTTVLYRGGRGEVIEVDSVDRGKILGLWWVTREDLTDLVDNSVAPGTESPDDLELDGGGIEIVVAVEMAGGDGKKSDLFTPEIKTLTDNNTWKDEDMEVALECRETVALQVSKEERGGGRGMGLEGGIWAA